MLVPNVRIREFLSISKSDEIYDFSLTSSENRRLGALVGQLSPLKTFIKKFQDDSTTRNETGALFAAMIEILQGTNGKSPVQM